MTALHVQALEHGSVPVYIYDGAFCLPYSATLDWSVTPLSRNHCLCCRHVLQLVKALLKAVSQGERGPKPGEERS